MMLAGRADEDLELRFHRRLSDVLLQPPRPDGALHGLLLAAREARDDSVGDH
jgi:hypothetical protein